uniref:Uncharacterized protein n=1 Tax=Glycine max TaxID=3847 RepID=C6TLJ8_SOYBN|nr:unknown [Glycine max]
MNYKSKSYMQYRIQNAYTLKRRIGGFHYYHELFNIEYSVRQETSSFQDTFKKHPSYIQKIIMPNHTTQKVASDQ